MKKYFLLFIMIFALFVTHCDDSGTNSKKEKYSGIIEGVDFDRLFAEPTALEIETVYHEWNSRTDELRQVTLEDTLFALIGNQLHTVHIISHVNGENLRHYGAVILPTDTTIDEFPVLFYNHGGDNGVDVNSFLTLATFSPDMSDISKKFFIAIPSFRSEVLIGSETYLSQGDPSPWDKDVDDCIGMLTAIQTTYSQSDMANVYVVGASRGAGVGMLWAARDQRIKKVIDFFGPTDLLSQWTKEICYDALHGNLVELPGLDYLNENIIQPLKNKTLSIDEARHELIKRSAVYFLSDITPLQVHHGTADEIVPVTQAERLIEVATELKLSEDEFQYYLHEYSGHDENTFMKGIDEMREFILNE
ncbi:MAG: hypothetical protein JXQ65_11675 [Candidatus Marinimicrobia bacterium]|nr:hypothetical protein [Candidatus Neomarinimicrobiota bacterium]